MAKEIGVRELKNQASQLVRAVREAEIDAELATMQELAKEIAAAWTSDKTGVELVEEQRR